MRSSVNRIHALCLILRRAGPALELESQSEIQCPGQTGSTRKSMTNTPFCPDPFSYRRRLTREVKVGKVGVGGHPPIRVQSMITCDRMDTEVCIRQTVDLRAV